MKASYGVAAPVGFQPASGLPPASSRWIANSAKVASRLQPDLLPGLQAVATYPRHRRLKAAQETSLKRAEKSFRDTSHHRVNVVANKMPAEAGKETYRSAPVRGWRTRAQLER